MKRITIVLATAAALGGCDDSRAAQAVLAPAAEAAVAANQWTQLSFEMLNPCNGETIPMSGQMHFVSRATSDGNGGMHIGGAANARFDGVGQATGTAYVAAFTTPFSINARPPYPMSVSDVYNLTVVGRGNATNFSAHFRFFMTVNANGIVTVERGDTEFVEGDEIESVPTCQGTRSGKG